MSATSAQYFEEHPSPEGRPAPGHEAPGGDLPSQGEPSSLPEEYPEQRHAGAVVLGPEYGKVKVEEKAKGFKEIVKGELRGDPGLVKQGEERWTGELKWKKQAEEDDNPFADTAEGDTQ